MTAEEIHALENAKPKPPREIELGGGIYYKCFWEACGEDLKRWFQYCPACGQKIEWGEDGRTDDFV